MPTMDRLAAGGLTYSQWHTTALCSPTRSTFLTGRNHHLNGFASISESSTGFPGYSSHIPTSNATMANVLREAGWSTFWVGKNHNIPIDEWTAGASKKRWPLGPGLRPVLRLHRGRDQQLVPLAGGGQQATSRSRTCPEDGYHLSKDLADQALRMIRDSKQTEPDKPWYLWFCPGANHAPHHAPEEYIAKYKGMFDDGYEAYREWVLPRMIERGILPEGTELTPINPMPDGTYASGDYVRPWEELNERSGGSSAGWRRSTPASRSTPTPRSGGSSTTSRSPASSTTRSSSTAPTTAPRVRAARTAPPTRASSSTATPTPSRTTWPPWTCSGRRTPTTTTRPGGRPRSRRRTGCSSATPTRAASATRWSIHWPRGIAARGEVRHQYHHCTDIVPTIYEACGVHDARRRRRRRADPAVRGLDGLLVRRRRGRDHEEDAVLRDVRQPRHLARRLEGRHRARTDQRDEQLRPGHLAALPHRRRPRRGARPRRRAPREGRRSSSPCGSRRPRPTTSFR